MIAVNYSNARERFKDFCDSANDDCETIVVTRKSGGNVVLMSEDQYNNLMENLFVRRNSKSYKRLIESVEQIAAGKYTRRELIDD